MNLESFEEVLPLPGKAKKDVDPQALDPYVMNTPTYLLITLEKQRDWRTSWTHFPQIYDPRPKPRTNSILQAHNKFSVP